MPQLVYRDATFTVRKHARAVAKALVFTIGVLPESILLAKERKCWIVSWFQQI